MNVIKNNSIPNVFPPNSYILGIEEQETYNTIILDYYSKLPFSSEHRHFTDYMQNLQNEILREYCLKFQKEFPKIVFEAITNEKSEIIYLCK